MAKVLDGLVGTDRGGITGLIGLALAGLLVPSWFSRIISKYSCLYMHMHFIFVVTVSISLISYSVRHLLLNFPSCHLK